jgi:hypothetical protein
LDIIHKFCCRGNGNCSFSLNTVPKRTFYGQGWPLSLCHLCICVVLCMVHPKIILALLLEGHFGTLFIFQCSVLGDLVCMCLYGSVVAEVPRHFELLCDRRWRELSRCARCLGAF